MPRSLVTRMASVARTNAINYGFEPAVFFEESRRRVLCDRSKLKCANIMNKESQRTQIFSQERINNRANIMNYQAIYDRIVARGKERLIEGYKERHHIIPRCMGGSDEPDNLVDLTPEEHYVCHQLLVKIHPDIGKLVYAAMMMSCYSPHQQSRYNNKRYGWLKRKLKRTIYSYNCKRCKTEFQSIFRNRAFCSFECSTNFKIEKKEIKICPTCSTPFKRGGSSGKYCSQACYRVTREVKIPWGCVCLNCSASFQRINGSTGKYCSQACYRVAREAARRG